MKTVTLVRDNQALPNSRHEMHVYHETKHCLVVKLVDTQTPTYSVCVNNDYVVTKSSNYMNMIRTANLELAKILCEALNNVFESKIPNAEFNISVFTNESKEHLIKAMKIAIENFGQGYIYASYGTGIQAHRNTDYRQIYQFSQIKIGCSFIFAGTEYVKKSSRTAYVYETPALWFYFGGKDRCNVFSADAIQEGVQ